MITRRDIISSIRSTHRLLSSDGMINDRAVWAELKNSASLLIKRELNLRKLANTDTLYTVIPCLEMIEVPLSECCDYVSTSSLSRTKERLPNIGESNYQYAVMGIFNIESSKKIPLITLPRYINSLELPKRKKETLCWVHNDYLYSSNSDVTKIKLVAYFEEDVPNAMLYSTDCGCKAPLEDLCKNPLDKEFKCPSYLIKQITDLTSQKLLSTYFKIPVDRQTDGADGQAVNQQGK